MTPEERARLDQLWRSQNKVAVGPPGPQGPQGDTGPQGPQGDTGPIEGTQDAFTADGAATRFGPIVAPTSTATLAAVGGALVMSAQVLQLTPPTVPVAGRYVTFQTPPPEGAQVSLITFSHS